MGRSCSEALNALISLMLLAVGFGTGACFLREALPLAVLPEAAAFVFLPEPLAALVVLPVVLVFPLVCVFFVVAAGLAGFVCAATPPATVKASEQPTTIATRTLAQLLNIASLSRKPTPPL
jgi:hypothetical protein